MLLGAMHLCAQISGGSYGENVLRAFATMRAAKFDFMGAHDLMQFYTGFSVTMGFMLFAFGLQAMLIRRPTRTVAITNAVMSLVAAVLAIVYFHPLAWTLLLLATLCFAAGAVKIKEGV